MKVVYLLRNPGIAGRTPKGWSSTVIAAEAGGDWSEAALREVEDADVLVVGLEPVDARLLDRAPRVRLIQRLGVGACNIDVVEAARRHIPVCNMPHFNAATVAEHTIMLILALLRRVFDSTLLMKAGQWPVAALAGAGLFDLQGRTLGIVGYGAIGRAVAERAAPFGVRLLYADPRGAAADAAGGLLVPLDELLRRADIVSLHLPLTRRTRGLIGRDELAAMKRTALLVNTARGAIVDEAALARALDEGLIAGAGLDVFSEEPLGPRHPLRRCRNVLLTPHTAGQTREAMERMVATMLDNVERVARGDEPRHRLDPVEVTGEPVGGA